MNIPENFKKTWLWLITGIMVIALVLGIQMLNRGDNKSLATITVEGKSEITAVPDVSRFTITIEETAQDQKTALAQNATKTNAVMTALKNAGIEEKDIQTQSRNDYPKYEYTRGAMEIAIYPPMPAQQTITGYVSSHTLSVKVRNLDTISSVQQIFADQKVSNVYGPELSLDDPEQLQADARREAIMDAKAKAKVLSNQLGVRLGKVVAFNESGNGAYPMYRMEAMASDSASAPKSSQPNIAVGEQTITAQVSVTYKIK
jgi:uncharacterized protein YggE